MSTCGGTIFGLRSPGVSAMRRVVVTGLGLVTPLACGTEQTWQRLRSGESGIKRIEKFDVSDIPCKIAGQAPRGDGSDGSFNPDDWMEPKEQRKVDDFIIFAMAAAAQALNDAGWHPREYEDQITSGVLIGSGIGGVEGIAETALLLRDRGPRRVSPFFIPGRLINLAFAQGSQSCRGHGLFDRRTRDWRCRPADCAWRRRRDAGGRHGVTGQ